MHIRGCHVAKGRLRRARIVKGPATNSNLELNVRLEKFNSTDSRHHFFRLELHRRDAANLWGSMVSEAEDDVRIQPRRYLLRAYGKATSPRQNVA